MEMCCFTVGLGVDQNTSGRDADGVERGVRQLTGLQQGIGVGLNDVLAQRNFMALGESFLKTVQYTLHASGGSLNQLFRLVTFATVIILKSGDQESCGAAPYRLPDYKVLQGFASQLWISFGQVLGNQGIEFADSNRRRLCMDSIRSPRPQDGC
jgi:hypothetical protein